jgi:hypothetical protein
VAALQDSTGVSERTRRYSTVILCVSRAYCHKRTDLRIHFQRDAEVYFQESTVQQVIVMAHPSVVPHQSIVLTCFTWFFETFDTFVIKESAGSECISLFASSL